MASQGPLYPTAAVNESVSPENTDAWVNPTNVGADDTSEATITAATYDSPDISQRLRATGFGFSVSGTIDGIVVEIMRRNSAGAASDNRVQLLNASGALVGDNKADTALDWPTTEALKTYGGSSDTWNASPTAAMINDPDFGVCLSVQADAANTDIQVDFIRVTVHYTPPAPISGTGAVTLAAPASAGSGKETFAGSGGIDLNAPAVAGTGIERIAGSGGVDLNAPAVAGSGTVTTSGVTGTGAVAIQAPTVSGSGALLITGAGVYSIAAPVSAGNGLLRLTGTGGLSLLAPVIAGIGLERINASGGVTIAAPSISGSSPVVITGTGFITIRAPSVSGSTTYSSPPLVRHRLFIHVDGQAFGYRRRRRRR